MDPELLKLYHQIKQRGLTPLQEQKILFELEGDQSHEDSPAVAREKTAASDTFDHASDSIYAYNDPFDLQGIPAPQTISPMTSGIIQNFKAQSIAVQKIITGYEFSVLITDN